VRCVWTWRSQLPDQWLPHIGPSADRCRPAASGIKSRLACRPGHARIEPTKLEGTRGATEVGASDGTGQPPTFVATSAPSMPHPARLGARCISIAMLAQLWIVPLRSFRL